MLATTQHRSLCVLSADTNILASVETAAIQAGLEYQANKDCRKCGTECASIVAVDVSRDDYPKLLAEIPRTGKNVVVGILPSTMPFQIPKQHGVEVIVYRDLMQRFMAVALKLSMLLIQSANVKYQRRNSNRECAA